MSVQAAQWALLSACMSIGGLDVLIDWVKITSEIRKHHGSLAKGAKSIGCCAETLRQINRGEIREPKFTLGVKILDAHFDVKENG